MFKKILSSAAVMLLALCMSSSAQQLKVSGMNFGRPSQLNSKVELDSDEFWWGYFSGNYSEIGSLGMGKNTKTPQLYDAAMCLEAGSAITQGKTIKGISFSFPNSTNIKNVRVWISNELPKNAESATVCCQAVENITGYESYEDFENEVRFDTPYKVDPSKDTYIGYSFVVDDAVDDSDRYPIFITGKNFPSHKKGLLIKVNGDDSKWEDYEPYNFGDLAIKVLMSGDFAENAGSLKPEFYNESVVKGGMVKLPLVVQNAGVKGIDRMNFVVDINGEKQDVEFIPEYKVDGISTKCEIELEVQAPQTTGVLPVKVTLTKVNDVDNPNESNVAEGSLIVVPEKVKHKVLVEEFTALWCGWCPRGFVALEQLRKDYGNDIVLAAAHINDEMDCKAYYDALIPNQPAPSAHVDRRHKSVDPYYGIAMYAEVPMAIKYEIDEFAEYAPVASVKANASLDGSVVTVKSDVSFLYTGKGSYGVGYAITQDGMQDDSWIQKNYFSGMNYDNDELLAPLTKEGKEIKGLVYNDVVIAAEGIANGIKGSIPEDVVENSTVSHEQTFDLGNNKLVMDWSKLKACVYLFDMESGRIVNADFVQVSDPAGIEGVEADDENSEEVARYTADGRRIYSAEKGINIVKYSDGKVKKVIVK